MKLSRIQRYLLSILSGTLMVIAFPYTGSLTFLVFVAWIPLLMVEHTIATQRYRSSKVFIHAYITFLIYNIGTTWWIWNADSSGAIMAFVFNSLLMALSFQVFHLIRKRLFNTGGYGMLLLVWLGFEYAHFHWELSWPWLTLGNVFSITPSFIQWYEFTGVLGGSLWILAVNILLFKILLNRFVYKKQISPKAIGVPVIILLLPLTLSFWMYNTYKEIGKTKEIVVTQPNIDPYGKFSTINPAEQLHRIATIAEKVMTNKTEYVLAPETAIPISFDEAIINYDPGYEILKEHMLDWETAELFIGASTEKRFDKKRSRATRKDPYGGNGYVEYYNSSLLMSPNFSPIITHKSKLVLGAEKVPFSHVFPFLENLSLDLGGTKGTLGIEPHPTNIKKDKFAFTPSICYESIYGEYTAEQTKLGSEAIFVITNDGWWGDTPGYKQHFSFSRLRAIENRKFVARSANTGTSGIINSRGDIVKSTKWWTIDAFKANILVNNKMTVYMYLGDIIGRIFLFITIALMIYSFFKKSKSTSLKEV